MCIRDSIQAIAASATQAPLVLPAAESVEPLAAAPAPVEPPPPPRAAAEPLRLVAELPPAAPAPSAAELPAPAALLPPGREPVVASDRVEMARVNAELLDQLLNNAGEVSIARARLEQQLGAIEFLSLIHI